MATATTASTAATPAPRRLLEIARELGVAGDYLRLASEIESVLKKKKALALCFNVDGVIGAFLCDLKLAPETGKALFVIPRTVGLLGPTAGTRARLVLPPLQRLGHLHRPGDAG